MFRRVHFGWVLWAAVIAVAVPAGAHAQDFTEGSTGSGGGAPANITATGLNVSTEVQRIMFLVVETLDGELTAPVDDDFDAADLAGTPAVVEDLDIHNVTVSANSAWALQLSGPANWTTTPSGTKAIGDLEYSTNSGVDWAALTTTPESIASGTAVLEEAVDISYRTSWLFGNTFPGAYATDLTLTLTAP